METLLDTEVSPLYVDDGQLIVGEYHLALIENHPYLVKNDHQIKLDLGGGRCFYSEETIRMFLYPSHYEATKAIVRDPYVGVELESDVWVLFEERGGILIASEIPKVRVRVS